MKIVIVEDEPVIAARLQRQVGEILSQHEPDIKWFDNFDDAQSFVMEQPLELLFLDLNLHGHSGFDLLTSLSAQSFFTIIVSAYAEQAIKAFEFGVLDFIAKPFNRNRLEQAINRYLSQQKVGLSKQLAVKKPSGLHLINLTGVTFVKADGHYTQISEVSGQQHLHDKAIDKLAMLLPENYIRIHRSYIVNSEYVAGISAASGGVYRVELSNGELLPISRSKYKSVKQQLMLE